MKIRKTLSIIIISSLLCSCGTSNTTDNVQTSNEQSTKEIELFNMVMTVPESCFIPEKGTPGYNNTSEDVEYLLFYDDAEDTEEKWRNQCIIQNMTNVNATPDITYDQAKVVIADPAKALFAYNTQWEVTNTESVNLAQTPALHYTANWEKNDATVSIWFVMSNYHDIMIFQFFHKNKAKYDFTEAMDNIVKNIHFKGLDGEAAFVIPANNNTTTDSSFTNKFGTPTTICNHPGCNNYIASTGDTNCCTEHSAKCLNCGKYIDEDAMYCMDCLEKEIKGTSSGS